MRNSLFWRILIVALLPLIILYLFIPQTSSLASLRAYLQSHIFLDLFILLLIIASSFLISNLYIQPLNKLEENLDKPDTLSKLFFGTRLLPKELQKLYKVILDKLEQTKQNRENFESEKALFSSILSNMNDGILVVDQSGSVSLINQAACRIFGISRNEALGGSLAEVIRHYKMNELFEKTIETGSPQIISFDVAPEKTYIRCIATPLDLNTNGNILFLMQDLTRIRQLEMIRRDFVSNVSPRTPHPAHLVKVDYRDNGRWLTG